jgi:peptide-methionine (S)-S-oxide reductase
MKPIYKSFILTLFVFIASVEGFTQAEMTNKNLEKATFGAGCFWCTEAVFTRVNGVTNAISGYSGGVEKNPTYEMITTGSTRYAEVTQITYDPEIVSYQTLLEVFWKTHDPTTLNRQGADVGPQYRSIIFYHNEEQRNIAEEYKQKLDQAEIWDDKIVTEIEAYTNFYEAEDYHQDFYENNPNYGYCRVVITPKIEKFENVFGDQLKK